MNNIIGIIRLPGFFAGKELTLLMDEGNIKRVPCKTGSGAVLTVKKQYVGKVIELDIGQNVVNLYFADRFRISGKRDDIPSGQYTYDAKQE